MIQLLEEEAQAAAQVTVLCPVYFGLGSVLQDSLHSKAVISQEKSSDRVTKPLQDLSSPQFLLLTTET